VVQGQALGRVGLSQVVPQRPDVVGVTGGQGFEGAAGADGVQLAVIAHGHQLGPRGGHRPQQFGDIGVGGHGGFVQYQDMARCKDLPAVLEAPAERRHRTRSDTGTFS
jgi:hypothetical protein